MLPTKEQISDRFAARLKQEIGVDDYAEVLRRNRTGDYQGSCASHDFCDSNMVMLDAFKDFGIPEEDVIQHDGVVALWSDAWNLWREQTR